MQAFVFSGGLVCLIRFFSCVVTDRIWRLYDVVYPVLYSSIPSVGKIYLLKQFSL